MTFEQFAEHLGLTLEVVRIEKREDGLGGQWPEGARHYDLRVMRGEKLIAATSYSQGPAITADPQIEDVLLSLFHDTCDLHGTDRDSLADFAEWTDHIGHDDLRRAAKMYEACHAVFDQMKDTLTHTEREAFFDCTEDEPEATEEELSEQFDAEILPFVIEQYGENDQPAINEAFNNWTDAECKAGILSDLAYNNYTYVGRLARD